MNFRAVILALALGATSAASDFKPTASLNVGHKGLSGLSLDAVTADVQLESEVSDELKVGVNVDRDASAGNPIKSVFAKLSQKMAGGDVDADVSMDMGDNGISGDVTYSKDGNTVLAKVSSTDDNIVESVELSRGVFKGTYYTGSKNIDLETSADLDADTNLLVSMSQGDNSATLEVNRKVDSDTDVKVNLNPGADKMGATVEVTRKIDGDNTVKPSFDFATNKLSCAWVRKLDAGRTATVSVDPDSSFEIEVEADSKSDWSGKVSGNWNSPGDSDVSISRQFSF